MAHNRLLNSSKHLTALSMSLSIFLKLDCFEKQGLEGDLGTSQVLANQRYPQLAFIANLLRLLFRAQARK